MQAPHGLNPEPTAGNPIVPDDGVAGSSGSMYRRSSDGGASGPSGRASTHTDPNPAPIARGPLSCRIWVIVVGLRGPRCTASWT